MSKKRVVTLDDFVTKEALNRLLRDVVIALARYQIHLSQSSLRDSGRSASTSGAIVLKRASGQTNWRLQKALKSVPKSRGVRSRGILAGTRPTRRGASK